MVTLILTLWFLGPAALTELPSSTKLSRLNAAPSHHLSSKFGPTMKAVHTVYLILRLQKAVYTCLQKAVYTVLDP
jgi:hypothetical protein